MRRGPRSRANEAAPPPADAPAPAAGPASADAPAPVRLSWFADRGGASRLRARYRPDARFSHVALSVAPWFDALLLLVAFLAFHRATALVPAETVDLPQAGFASGARSSVVLAVRALPAAPPGAEIAAMAFLGGVAYDLARPGRADELRADLEAAARAAAETNALVYMDEALPHGAAVRIAGILRDAGLGSASFVTRQ